MSARIRARVNVGKLIQDYAFKPRSDTFAAYNDAIELSRVVISLAAQVDEMRAVVEAAERWRDAKWNSGVRRIVTSNLRTAIDAIRSQKEQP